MKAKVFMECNLRPGTITFVKKRCPEIVAERIFSKAKEAEVKDHDAYALTCLRNWEVSNRRRAIVEEKKKQERELERAAEEEMKVWDEDSRRVALWALNQKNTINCITLVLWIESGLSGNEFANSVGISRDNLYQRKLRARLEILSSLDFETAAWLYQYGGQRQSYQKAETKRRKIIRQAECR